MDLEKLRQDYGQENVHTIDPYMVIATRTENGEVVASIIFVECRECNSVIRIASTKDHIYRLDALREVIDGDPCLRVQRGE